MLTQLSRNLGQTDITAREMNRLLSIHPNNIKIIKLKVVLEIEAGNYKPFTDFVNSKPVTTPKSNQIISGLFLAEIYLEAGNNNAT